MDCIAAIATGTITAAAIGIVRVSGTDCFPLCDTVFHPYNGQLLSDCPARTMVYGSVTDNSGTLIDSGLAVRFPAPNSYTGEDSVEFHCHGSPIVLQILLDALFRLGARQAKAGEFTKRAFLNGRMDLTQAEAVVDLIDAETAAAAKNAAAQLDGNLSRDFDNIIQQLLDLAARFYAVVDYPDEDIEDVHPAEILQTLDRVEESLSRLLDSFDRGKVLKQGVRTAIIGLPNAGKSSLLNALTGHDRAIVTNVPGTTRDTIEESVLCGGVLLRLIDTAGLHETDDAVEKLGVERSRRAADSADLIFTVHDSAAPLSDTLAPDEYLNILNVAIQSGKPWIALESKCDLSGKVAFSMGTVGENPNPPAACICISSVTRQGFAQLEHTVSELFPVGSNMGHLLTNPRQEDAVRRARTAIARAKSALLSGLTPDAAVTDIESALDAIGELTGRTAKDSIVDEIFSRFCVGK